MTLRKYHVIIFKLIEYAKTRICFVRELRVCLSLCNVTDYNKRKIIYFSFIIFDFNLDILTFGIDFWIEIFRLHWKHFLNLFYYCMHNKNKCFCSDLIKIVSTFFFREPIKSVVKFMITKWFFEDVQMLTNNIFSITHSSIKNVKHIEKSLFICCIYHLHNAKK